MPDYEPLVSQIIEQSGVIFRAASPLELGRLEALDLPQSVLDFYSTFEPSDCVECQVRLWPIEHVLEENDALVPGCYTSKFGYVVFATTLCGDAYCFDLSRGRQADPRIVLIPHEFIDEDTTAAETARLAKPVARNLHEFLGQMIRGEVDEECIYE